MPRKIIVRTGDGRSGILLEVPATDEFQLQELIKNNQIFFRSKNST